MNLTLKELLDQYSADPTLKTQEAVSNFYVKNPDNRSEIKEELKSFFRTDYPKGGIGWELYFDFDMTFWQDIYLINEEKTAKEYLSLYSNGKKDFFLNFASNMLYSSCNNTLNIPNLNGKIEKVWFEVFKNEPEFMQVVNQSRIERAENLKKYMEELNLPEKIEPITCKVLEISVPVLMNDEKGNVLSENDTKKILETNEYNDFMAERSRFFNNFNLHAYMKIPECHSVSLNVERDTNVFQLKMNKETDEKYLEEALFGQLTAGLGSSLSSKNVLIGDKILIFKFDVENASPLSEIQVKTKKFKM